MLERTEPLFSNIRCSIFVSSYYKYNMTLWDSVVDSPANRAFFKNLVFYAVQSADNTRLLC